MPTKPQPTDAELEILSVIWDHERATVREVHTVLSKGRDIGYTTVLKLMQIMAEKGLLIRDESERSHIYRPAERATAVQKRLVLDLIKRAFGGSPDQLVMHALSAKKASKRELEDIRKLLDEIDGEKSK